MSSTGTRGVRGEGGAHLTPTLSPRGAGGEGVGIGGQVSGVGFPVAGVGLGTVSESVLEWTPLRVARGRATTPLGAA
jgi:hypothetical protein